jgi:hypothetical protein
MKLKETHHSDRVAETVREHRRPQCPKAPLERAEEEGIEKSENGTDLTLFGVG